MKIIIILFIWSIHSYADTITKQVDLENVSTKGLDKDVAKVFDETKQLIIESRQNDDTQSELLGTKKWCYLLHNFNFLEQAKSCYYLIGTDAETEAVWPYLYAKAALTQGNIEDASKGFLLTINRELNYLPAHYHLIQLSIEQGNLLQAFAFQSKVPPNLKLTANMLNITGDLYTQVENYYVANGFYQQALSLVPQANSLNYKIAQNLIALGQIELAENIIKKSGKIGISLPDPYYQQVKETTVGEIPYLIKAKTALNNFDYKKAINYYNKALEFNPNSNSAKINIAVAYFQDNQVIKSREIFEKLNLESPKNLKVLYNLAIIAKIQNEITLAIKYYVDYRLINKLDKTVNGELAELYYLNKEYDKVIEFGNESVMASDEIMQILKAKSLIHLKQFSQSIELLTEIIKHKPNNNEALLLLAKLYSQVPNTELRNAELSLQYAQRSFKNEVSQLSYWQLLMALDESKKCNELKKTAVELAQYLKVDSQQVQAQFSLQRGNEIRCELD